MGKPITAPQPGVYRDNPDRDDAASTSSAVLLDDIDYPDEELPSYSDDPNPPNASGLLLPGSPRLPVAATSAAHMSWYSPPPDLPFSSHDVERKEFRTRFPDYSTNADTLLKMIHEQILYPPTYMVQLSGNHTETVRRGNKETKNKVTDFLIQINITHLLTPRLGTGAKVEILPDNKHGYRGGRFPSFNPTVGSSDVENQVAELKAWCEAYVSNPAGVKSFTLKREIINHDTKKLEQLLRSAIAETGYRGHLHVVFPLSHKCVIVYSPGKINEWRVTTWIRWIFYLTFLWLFAWPILFFLTHKYEVVSAIYAYANMPEDDGGSRECAVMSEVDWYHRWESSIKRAAFARMICKDRVLDEEYRIATAEADARGMMQGMNPRAPPSTGNTIADGALGFLTEGLRVAEGWRSQGGWGGDC